MNPDILPKIYVFYHIYCIDHISIDIVKDQIIKIIYSGLYDKVDAIYCYLTGKEEIIDFLHKYLSSVGKKIIIKIVSNDTTYERLTLLEIRNIIKPQDKFLYIHSKGVTKGINQNVWDWRNLMEYYLFRKYELCLEKLDEYDTVGINYTSSPWHYSGNFWWCKGSYYLTLPDTIGERYHDTEFYVCSKSHKAYSLYNTNLNHYHVEYPFTKFIDDKTVETSYP